MVKIDVEGSEAGVVAGAKTVLKSMRPLLLMELNERALHAQHQSASALLQTLRSDLSYEVLVFSHATGLIERPAAVVKELVENSLRFSPPDSTVEIDGRSLGQGGYQLAVIDHGVGMADVELVAANQRLAGLDEVDGLPTRYLGQYVIAKLAAKTGAIVRLQPTVNGRGVTAVVSLPATATIGGSDRSTISQPLPGSRGALDNSADLFAPGAGLTTGVAQPDAVLDPSADPFAEIGRAHV